MDKKQKILEARERLDSTLVLPDLLNADSVKSLVNNQLKRSLFHGHEGNIEKVVEKRSKDVSYFLEMLRSASGKGQQSTRGSLHNDWKVKQDTDQLRVMYREGPSGTPFHTLLSEGFADGPIDVCLCVSWESTLYRKWWPQYNIPTFKITMSTCLRKVCIGDEISLIRVKCPWPVSDREALLHYFEIEYLKEDLIIVLLNTISDTEDVDVSTHGFSRDGIPNAKDTVRIDLVGGFVIQRIDATRSYFRVIANMDIKLDFVPPALINFISRQLIGNGHKLYQKAVGSVATSDEDFRKALEGPMYARIRESLGSSNKVQTTLLNEEKHEVTPEEHRDFYPPVVETSPVTEIVEEETDQNQNSSSIIPVPNTGSKDDAFVSPEVESALRTLDQAIAFVRDRASSGSNQSDCFSINQELPASRLAEDITCRLGVDALPSSSNIPNKAVNVAQVNSHAEDFSLGLAVNGAIVDQGEFIQLENRVFSSHQKALAEATVTTRQPPITENMRKVCDEESLRASYENKGHRNITFSSNSKQHNEKKQWLCCLSFSLFPK